MSPGSQPLPHPPGTIAEGVQIVPEYRLEKRLGKGGFGEVWKAIGPGKVPAALKIILVKDSEAGQREFRSLDLLRNLRHPNLLPIQGYWLLDDVGQVINDDRPPSTLVIAMLLGGKNLRQRLSECQQAGFLGIPPDELLEYMRDAAKGIDFLNRPIHQLGDRLVAIQHRDIKPQNLMIVGGGLMVADFGIAGVMESSHVHTEHAAMTYAYAAPELFDHSASAWTDQYALAITYCQLRAGRLPFADKITSTQIMSVHIKGTHDFSGLTTPEIEVLKRATARIPEQRFASCLEFVSRLEAAVQTADSAPTVHMERRSDQHNSTPKGDSAETEGTAAFTPSYAEHLHATKDSTRNKTVPVQSKDSGRRSWLLGGSLAGLVAMGVLVAGLISWQQGVFDPPQAETKVEKEVVVQSTPPVPFPENGEGKTKTPPKTIQPAPTLDDLLQRARGRATTSLNDHLYDDVVLALEPVFQANRQESGDFMLRGKARLALADAGTTPEENYQQAAADFAAANSPLFQGKALACLGTWLVKFGKPQLAIPQLQEALRLQGKTPADFRLQLTLCEAHLAAKDAAAAMQQAESALEELGDEVDGHREIAARLHFTAALAGMALAEGPPPNAQAAGWDQKTEKHFQQAIALAMAAQLDDLAIWQSELSAFRKLPRMIAREEMRLAELRIVELTKELEKSPDDSARLLELAELEKKTDREKPAAAHFARGYGLRAIELAGMRKLEEATQAASQAVQHDPNLAIVQYAQAVVAIQANRHQEALPFLDAAITKTPDGDAARWQYLATRGRTLAEIAAGGGTRQDWQRARTDLEAAIATFPNADALLANRSAPAPAAAASRGELAGLYFSLGSSLRALAQLDSRPDTGLLEKQDQAFLAARTLDEKDVRYALAAGQSLLQHARAVASSEAASLLTNSGELLSQALELDSKLAAAHNSLGECLLLKGQVAAAQAEFEKAVETGEKEPVAARYDFYLNLCDAYLRPPRNDAKALAAADRAVALDSKDAQGHFHRGLALRNLARNTEAVAAFEEALVHQPKHVFALLAKSKLIVETETSTQRQLDQADRDIETAFAAAATEAQKAEAHYVQSLASLKLHLAHADDRALAEPALLKTERELLLAVTIAPANGIYAKAAADLFEFAASYSWSNAQRQADSDKLQQEWKKIRKPIATK